MCRRLGNNRKFETLPYTLKVRNAVRGPDDSHTHREVEFLCPSLSRLSSYEPECNSKATKKTRYLSQEERGEDVSRIVWDLHSRCTEAMAFAKIILLSVWLLYRFRDTQD